MPRCSDLGFPSLMVQAEFPYLSPTPGGQSLPKTKSGGWSYCSPSVLETTLPRHLEGGRNTVKLSSFWDVCASAVARNFMLF